MYMDVFKHSMYVHQVQPSPLDGAHTLAKGGGPRLPENKQREDFVPRLLSMPSTGKAFFEIKYMRVGVGEQD